MGEFAIIDSQARSTTAKALSSCTLLTMTQDRFLSQLANSPQLALSMCQQLVHKARWTSLYAETMAQFDAAGRLLQFLLYYKDIFGEKLEDGSGYRLDLGLNQSDLATLIGAGRGWVNHILSEWRKRELVEFERGVIKLLDLPRIEAERDGRANGQNETSW
jgi:CRP-like cAMP-binding protein